MGSVRTGVGLFSGVDFTALTDSIIGAQRTPILRMEQRVAGFQATQSGFSAIEATIIAIKTSVQSLGSTASFNSFAVSNSDTGQLTATTNANTVAGNYKFQSVQLAGAHSSLSKGFANADTQKLGAGTITVSTGGQLHEPTLLDALNGGSGIGRGKVQITDRSGSSATIDLSSTQTVDDVLAAINNNTSISVTASVDGDKFVLTDTSGSTASNLIVADVGLGTAAEDLGIEQSTASDVLTGSTVYTITDDFSLDLINDGDSIRRLTGAPDIRITLTDDSTIEVNLDDAVTLRDVVNLINDHDDNGGSVTASLTNGRLQLVDNSGGGGSSPLIVEDINESTVVRQLGLDATAAGTTLTGNRLSAGLNSVLLRNLRGGQGIDQLGQISLTDRSGTSTTIDLSSAESLDEVINAINTATDGPTALQLTASINSTGNGITITDTSGATASNLIIADVGGSTLANQLSIEVDAAQTSVDSGRLSLRHVGENTSIDNYAADGAGIDAGSIRITDSAGNVEEIVISSAVKNIGDVLQRINGASTVQVTAELNETGDGFVLIDNAGGAGTLTVEEVDGTTAADLRLLGDSYVGTDSKHRVTSRFAPVIEIDSDDTLNDLVEKINAQGKFVQASVFNDGSAISPSRLSLTSTTSGFDGALVLEHTGIDFNFNTTVQAKDALLRIGDNAETGFLISSSTNSFTNTASGIDVSLKAVGTSTAEIDVSLNFEKIESTIQGFVNSYNTFASTTLNLTSYNPETEERGILQGEGTILRVESRFQSLLNRTFGDSSQGIRSLAELGVRVGEGGRLTFNSDTLAQALEDDPNAVSDFFLTEETGFADVFETTIDTFTDEFNGTFKVQNESLQNSVDALTARITQLDEILAVRRERLLLSFIQMETILSQLDTQQQALTSIQSVKAPS